MKLVENARSGGLQPERLSDVLSAVSLSAGQDCRSQILMQLIVLIQQQLAAAANITNSEHNTTDQSAVVKRLQHINTALSAAVEDESLLHGELISDIETGDTNNKNEMDKLLAWKSRIESASLTGSEQLNGTVEQSKVSGCMIADAASADTPVQNHTKTDASSSTADDDNHTHVCAVSSEMTSCMVTDVVQSASCCSVSPQLTTQPVSPVLSSAGPPNDKRVEFPPLPTPPKPPANLLMNVECCDKQDLSTTMFAPAVPLPPLPLNSAMCSKSAAQPVSDVSKSPDTERHLHLPLNAATSFDECSESRSGNCSWLEQTAVSGGQTGSHCLLTCAPNALVSHDTFGYDANHEVVDNSRIEFLPTENSMTEAWHADSSNNSFPQLKSEQKVNEQPHSKVRVVMPTQDLRIQQSRVTRLKSPSSWMARLASPSVFVLQSSASKLQSAADAYPEAVSSRFIHSEQRGLPQPELLCAQRSSSFKVDNHHFVEHSSFSHISHSEAASHLILNDTQSRDFDDISSHGKGFPTKPQEGLESARGNHLNVDTSRNSTDKVLLRLAGMPVLSNVSVKPDNSDVAVPVVSVATRQEDSSAALAGSPASNSQRSEPSGHIADCNMMSAGDYGIGKSDERSNTSVLRSTVDQEMCQTTQPADWHSDVMSCDEPCTSSAVRTCSSQQTTSHHEIDQQQQQEVNDEDDLEEGEIVDDCSPTPTNNQHELPQATKQLLFFLKTDPVRKSSSSQWQHPYHTETETSHRRRNDKREDFHKHRRSVSTSRRQW